MPSGLNLDNINIALTNDRTTAGRSAQQIPRCGSWRSRVLWRCQNVLGEAQVAEAEGSGLRLAFARVKVRQA